MQSLLKLIRLRLLVVAVVLMFGCDSSTDGIKALPTGKSPSVGGRDDRNSSQSGDLFDKSSGLFDDDDDDDDDGSSSGSLDASDDDGEVEDVEIVFPDLDFKGDGHSTCKGKSYTSLAGITTKLSKTELDINLHRNRVIVDDKAQDKADKQIARSRGHTIYDRLSDQELKDLRDDGFESARFAIFARGVEKQAQQQQYSFSEPLPVFPWPARASRYEDLDDGPMSWSASVSGHKSFNVTITVSKESEVGDKVKLKFRLDISGDSAGELYEEFPIPREAIYEINTESRDVRSIDSTNLYFGNESCESNSKETVKMFYKLCKKTTEGDVEDIGPCQ